MVRFKMIGRDIDSFPAQYRTWIVDDQPDLTGQLYTGHKSGANPLMDIEAYIIYDSSVVADFNLPDPLSWNTTKRVLPQAIAYSHLAVIGDYVYLFGGQVTNKIFRATLDNPATWFDTGAVLPTDLYAGQLAIVDDRVYIFGGNDGEATDAIYSAPISDPLDWTNHGSLLPRKLHSSQLAIVDGYIYLYGGSEVNSATDVIFKASTDDPLTWVDTGDRLPVPLYNSQIAIINGNILLFGGQTSPVTPVDTIYLAPTSNPTFWHVYSFLPYAACGGQFFTVGNRGYLATPAVTPSLPRVRFTRILRCNLSSPGQWIDTLKTIPGEISQSQVGIIYDRLFLFGGSGSSAIFANNYELKYKFGSVTAVTYGVITRTQYNTTPNKLDLFRVIGFPPWKTDYGS